MCGTTQNMTVCTVIGALDTVESTKSTISIDLRSFTLRTTNNSFLYQDSTKNALISRCRKGSASSFFVQRFWRVPVLTLQWQPLSWLAKLRIRAARPWHTSPTSEMWCQNFSLRQIKKLASDLPLAIVLGMAAWPREAIGMYPKMRRSIVFVCAYFWPSDLEITRSRNLEKNALCVKKCIYIIDESWSTLSSSLTFPPSNESPVAFGCSCLVHLQDFFICQIFCFFCQGCPQTWWMVSLYIGPNPFRGPRSTWWILVKWHGLCEDWDWSYSRTFVSCQVWNQVETGHTYMVCLYLLYLYLI